MFPQVRLDFVLIQAIRNLAETHDDDAPDTARGYKPAFTEDLYAGVLIERQGYAGGHDEKGRPAGRPKSILQAADSSSDRFRH